MEASNASPDRAREVMTPTDAADLWDLLCRVDGPRPNRMPDYFTDEEWRLRAIDAWWQMAQRCEWQRDEVFAAVEELATWAAEDEWRWPHDDGVDRKPVMPAHINQLLALRRATLDT